MTSMAEMALGGSNKRKKMTKRRETESEKEIEERVTRRSNSNMKGHARISTKMYPLAAAAHVSVFTCACVSVGVGGGGTILR